MEQGPRTRQAGAVLLGKVKKTGREKAVSASLRRSGKCFPGQGIFRSDVNTKQKTVADLRPNRREEVQERGTLLLQRELWCLIAKAGQDQDAQLLFPLCHPFLVCSQAAQLLWCYRLTAVIKLHSSGASQSLLLTESSPRR